MFLATRYIPLLSVRQVLFLLPYQCPRYFSSLSAVSQNAAKNQPLFFKASIEKQNFIRCWSIRLFFRINLSVGPVSLFTVPSIYLHLHLHFVLMLPNIDLWLCVSSVTVALSTALRLWVLPPLCVFRIRVRLGMWLRCLCPSLSLSLSP